MLRNSPLTVRLALVSKCINLEGLALVLHRQEVSAVSHAGWEFSIVEGLCGGIADHLIIPLDNRVACCTPSYTGIYKQEYQKGHERT